jgi:predicted secreted hydrolase
MTHTITRKTSKVWVIQTITLPSGGNIDVCSVPFDRWMDDTDMSKTHNKLKLKTEEDRAFMLNLRNELFRLSERLQPGTQYEHKGFTLYHINHP